MLLQKITNEMVATGSFHELLAAREREQKAGPAVLAFYLVSALIPMGMCSAINWLFG